MRQRDSAKKQAKESQTEQCDSEKTVQKNQKIEKVAAPIEEHKCVRAEQGGKSPMQQVPWVFWMAIVVLLCGVAVSVYHYQKLADDTIEINLGKIKSEAEAEEKYKLRVQTLTSQFCTVAAAFVFVYVLHMLLEYWGHETAQLQEVKLIQEEGRLARASIEDSEYINGEDKRIAKDPMIMINSALSIEQKGVPNTISEGTMETPTEINVPRETDSSPGFFSASPMKAALPPGSPPKTIAASSSKCQRKIGSLKLPPGMPPKTIPVTSVDRQCEQGITYRLRQRARLRGTIQESILGDSLYSKLSHLCCISQDCTVD